VKRGIKIIAVKTVDEVLKHALIRPLVPIEWNEKESVPSPAAAEGAGGVGEVLTH